MDMERLELTRMNIIIADSLNSRECARHLRDGQTIRVFRNVFVHAEYLEGIDRWEFARRVNVVRALAVSLVLGEAVTISHETALALHGVDREEEFVRVHVSSARRWGGRQAELPPIVTRWRRSAPAVPLVRHLGVDRHARQVLLGPVRVCDLATAAVQCATSLSARDGVVAVSGALRMLSRFDQVRGPEARRREQAWRARLLEILEECPRSRNCRRARAVITAADAGCESVGERILLWILRSHGLQVETQVVYRADGRTYRVDFIVRAGRGLRVLVIEFDGRAKYGATVQDVLENFSGERRRQKDLESLGLTLVRFEWAELANPAAVVAEVARRCGMAQPPRVRAVLSS